jgi:uncharacterized protein HemX
MQRVTKYRLMIAVLGLAVIGLATYGFMLQRDDTQLRDQAAKDKQHTSESETKLSEAKRVIDAFKSEASGRTAAQSTMQQAVAAFSRQAEACQAVKQQLHIQE